MVSVLVTAQNNERHVAATIESVLRQSLADLELLIVDDGSRDSTPDLLSQIVDERVAVTIHTESAGIPPRRNELLARARGRYIAPLDADDVWFPDRLARQVAVLEAQPSLTVVGSDVMVVDNAVGIGPYFRAPRSDAAIRWWSL
ncbi:MAG TPA: glycosyltransferase family A protein, partial [Gaiellaceae bacterium]